MSAAATLTGRARLDGSSSGNPVRRNSRAAGGDWEKLWAQMFSRGALARLPRILRSHRDRLHAEWLKLSPRERRRVGDDGELLAPPPPTATHLRVIDVLISMAAGKERFLAICAAALARRAGCSIATVHRAIARLVSAGMLQRQRRCRPTGAQRGEGPTWEQDVNLYRLVAPPGAKRQLARAAEEEDGRRKDKADALGAAHRAELRATGRGCNLRAPPGPRPPAGEPPLTPERAAELDRVRALIEASPRVGVSRK